MAFLKRKQKLKYSRVMLKLSGEMFSGKSKQGIDFDFLDSLCEEIAAVRKLGVQVAIVIGGGNFWRYRDYKHTGLDRVNSDYIGIIATELNSMALAGTLKKHGLQAEVLSALSLPTIVEDFSVRKARKLLSEENIVICAGGTGEPYFTTDTAAALRAAELECDVLMKATNVDYLFTSDPKTDKSAQPIESISYLDVLKKRLRVMDLSAITLCQEATIPVIIFNLQKKGNIVKIVSGKKLGTLIS